MPLSSEDIRALVAAFGESDWDELSVTVDGTQLTVRRNGAPTERPVPSAAPPQVDPPATGPAAAEPSAGAAPPPAGHRITSPSVGLFWRSPQPGAPPFVEVGDSVGPADTVCIIEVMKLMNHVRAGTAGVVREIHPENGQMVEHGQPLFTVDRTD